MLLTHSNCLVAKDSERACCYSHLLYENWKLCYSDHTSVNKWAILKIQKINVNKIKPQDEESSPKESNNNQYCVMISCREVG